MIGQRTDILKGLNAETGTDIDPAQPGHRCTWIGFEGGLCLARADPPGLQAGQRLLGMGQDQFGLTLHGHAVGFCKGAGARDPIAQRPVVAVHLGLAKGANHLVLAALIGPIADDPAVAARGSPANLCRIQHCRLNATRSASPMAVESPAKPPPMITTSTRSSRCQWTAARSSPAR